MIDDKTQGQQSQKSPAEGAASEAQKKPKKKRRRPRRPRPNNQDSAPKPLENKSADAEMNPNASAKPGTKPSTGKRKKRPPAAGGQSDQRPAASAERKPDSAKPKSKRPTSRRKPQRADGDRPKPPTKPAPLKADEPEEILLQYSVHQLSQRPLAATAVITGIILVGYLAYSAYPYVIFGGVAVAILVFSISAFLFPIRYKFTNKAVYFRNFFSSERREWHQFYDYFVFKDAVQLAFDYRTVRGRVQKGILVYFDKTHQHKDKLLEIAAAKIKKPPRDPSKALKKPSLFARLLGRRTAPMLPEEQKGADQRIED